jgi:hypothetical protein
MNLEDYLAQWVEEAPALAGSVLAVLFMVGVAAALGFRQTARINDADLERLAAAEGARLEGALIAPNAKSALAQLEGGKLMIARVMGADVSARVAPAAGARVTLCGDTLSVAFADTGFPPLHMAIEETPPWLSRLAAGDAS